MNCSIPLQFLFFGKVYKGNLLFTCRMSNVLLAIELSAFNFICFSVGDLVHLGISKESKSS